LIGNVSESCNHFSVVAGGGPYAIAIDESLTVTVRYEPAALGSHTCTIETGNELVEDVYCSGFGFTSGPPGMCSKEGDPAFYVNFEEDTRDVERGQVYCWTLAPTNFGFVSALCPDPDTFCMHVEDTGGWVIVGDPPLQQCNLLDPGYLYWQDVCITVPCGGEIGDRDTVVAVMAFCGGAMDCVPDCLEGIDCEDPNWYGGDPYYSADTIVLHIVESPPSLIIVQDSLYTVEQGQSGAYVPFTICNQDICAAPASFGYTIASTGNIGGVFPQSDSTGAIAAGECEDVYAVVDAGTAEVCTIDTLTIVAWDCATGTTYDTCVQLVHVVEGWIYVPLFSTPVLAMLVLIMIAGAAVLLRRRFAGRA
jgi:hypothetical protein